MTPNGPGRNQRLIYNPDQDADHSSNVWPKMLSKIVTDIFSGNPETVLFHYTSYSGLSGIADSKTLRLSESRHPPDDIQIRGNRTPVPPSREQIFFRGHPMD